MSAHKKSKQKPKTTTTTTNRPNGFCLQMPRLFHFEYLILNFIFIYIYMYFILNISSDLAHLLHAASSYSSAQEVHANVTRGKKIKEVTGNCWASYDT